MTANNRDATPPVAHVVVAHQPRLAVPVGTVIGVTAAVPIVNPTIRPTEHQQWPFAMCCSCCCHLCADPGLALYAALCPTCLAAEIHEAVGAAGFCGTTDALSQWCAACCLETIFWGFGLMCAVGPIIGPWVWTLWMANGRDAMKSAYSLPNDELVSPCTCTTFLPYYCAFSCSVCAVYQQALFLKHTVRLVDFKCCLYRDLFARC